MRPLRKTTFAIPGDIETLTGGYIYERRLLLGLRDQGRDVEHLQLPAEFPDADETQMAMAVQLLRAVPPDRALILDGLVFGAIDTHGLAQIRAPIIAMIHHPLALESGLAHKRRDHLYRTERDNLQHARHVLVPSPHTRQILIDSYHVAPDRITIARPGTDPPKLPPRLVAPPLILSVGILHPRKGHDILINALTQIADLDWQAVIIGNPWHAQHASALQDQVNASGLGDKLRLVGQVPADELHRHYAAASIFALATRYEGYGIVFDEALSYGLPIVTCATGAVPQTVPSNAGLLVPPEDSPAFARALRQILGNAERRAEYAANARHAGQKLPAWSETAGIVGLVLDQLD